MLMVKVECIENGVERSLGLYIDADCLHYVEHNVSEARKWIQTFDSYTLSIGDDFRIQGKLSDYFAHRLASANVFESTYRTLCESLS